MVISQNIHAKLNIKIMAKTKTHVCADCLEDFPAKQIEWIETKTFKWVPAEVDNSHYKIPVCKTCKEVRQNA